MRSKKPTSERERLHQEWLKACEDRALFARAEATARAYEAPSPVSDEDLNEFEPELPPDVEIALRQAAVAHEARLDDLRVKRSAVFRRDGPRCWLCGGHVRPAHYNMERCATLDHVIPVSKGGPDDVENLRIAHKFCNELRDTMHPAEAWAKLETFAREADPSGRSYWEAPARTYTLDAHKALLTG